MKNDLNLTFGQIFQGSFEAFHKQLQDIQRFRTDRDESEEWVQNLRFLDVSGVPDLCPVSEEPLRKRKRLEDHGRLQKKRKMVKKRSMTIPIIKRGLGTVPYIAVSWRWTSEERSSNHNGKSSFDYRISRPGRSQKLLKSEFPDHYLERVIKIAQSRNVHNIWIDKESIYQRKGDEKHYPNDQELGIQIMDVVYSESTFSLALLDTPLTTQSELDLLSELLTRSVFIDENDKDNPQLSPKYSRTKLEKLILKILRDVRWSRGWIFQEDHLSSDRMVLLIPHAKHLSQRAYRYMIPGELEIDLARFRQAVTMFCLASPDPDSATIREILGKVKQYNIWNKRVYKTRANSWKRTVRPWNEASSHRSGYQPNNNRDYQNVSLYPSTTASILDDICNRDLAVEADRVPIFGNAARYSIRLDTSESSELVRSTRYSLSTVLLALLLLNGEILRHNRDMKTGDIMKFSLQAYLKKCQYRFNAPNFKFEQSFIDHCRLRPPRITKEGVQTKGFLFELLPAEASESLKLSDRKRKTLDRLYRNPRAIRIWRGRKLNSFAEEVIDIIIANLRRQYGYNSTLAKFLYKYLQLEKNPPPKDQSAPSTPYILDMISALVTAILDERDVRLAVSVEELGQDQAGSPFHVPDPVAIFIPPIQTGRWHGEGHQDQDGNEARGPLVFTSWDNGSTGRRMERLASIEVSEIHNEVKKTVKGSNNRGYQKAMQLRNLGWVNGIWDVRGLSMGSYTFPLPGINDTK